MGPPPLLPEDGGPLSALLAEPLDEPVLATAAVTVIDADADLSGSAVEAAEIVTTDGEGTEVGAV